jgi:hypothetical protein
MDADDADIGPAKDGPDRTAGEPAGARGSLAAAMAEVRDEHPRVPNEPADRYWLRMGLSLGTERPEHARLLLGQLESEAGVSKGPAPGRDGGSDSTRTAVDIGATSGGEEAPVSPAEAEVPLPSMLLVRSATLPAADKQSFDPEAVFGWAARVTRDDVLWMGRVVDEMLAEGLTSDLAKGFAITWRAGLKLPDSDFAFLFRAFTELELTVGGVLAGYDLRNDSRAPKQGWFGSLFGSLASRGDSRAAEAGRIVERTGKPGQRGLIAMWNAWAALRYREHVPAGLFEQLVRPWVTVVGRLPEA